MEATHPEVARLSFEGGDQRPPQAMPAAIGKDDDRAEQAVSPFPLQAAIADEAIGLEPEEQAARVGEVGAR